MIEVNVLKVLAKGENPLTCIREVAEALAFGESVRVVAPFEPKPLLEMLEELELEVVTKKKDAFGYVIVFHRMTGNDLNKRRRKD
ncbi:MAG: DUF2249 domain-containing protein [Opitutaceae bacterium]|nr:DUF2249 domain-containing protein [Opitutaceae bacterium]